MRRHAIVAAPSRARVGSMTMMNGMAARADPELIALAWLVLAALVACVWAIVALTRTGKAVPLFPPPRLARRPRR